MSSSWLNVALVLLILGGLLISLKWAQHSLKLHPEVPRKALHISMGLVAIAFPWLFDSPLPVIVLGGLAIAVLTALRLYKPLSNSLGSVLGSVKRRSHGELYFSASIVLLFLLAQGNVLLYCIPMLVLTLADAVAALVGVRYGQHRYVATEGHKSAEGSLTFFITAFFSVHIPLLLFSTTGRAETLLVALILGLLVMLLEAIAWHGLDNLFIPLGTFLLLKTHLEMDLVGLTARFIVTLLLVSFVLLWRRRTTLNDSALLGAVFMGYLSWSIGGWQWLLAPLTLFISYPFLIYWVDPKQTSLTPLERQVMIWLPADYVNSSEGHSGSAEVNAENADSHTEHFQKLQRWERVHNIYAVLSVSAGGLLWLFLFRTLETSELLYPYTLAFATNLAVICIASLSPVDYWNAQHHRSVATYICKSWLLMFAPILFIQGMSERTIVAALLGLLGVAVAAIAYYVVQPRLSQGSTDVPHWISRAILTTLPSCLSLLPFV